MVHIDMNMPKSCYSCEFVKDYNGKLYCNNSAGMTDGEYVDGCNTERHEDCPLIEVEQQWTSCSKRLPDEGRECWITPITSNKVYRGIFTKFYGPRHDVGFICDDGFMWLNTVKAWMYCEKPEPYQEGGGG